MKKILLIGLIFFLMSGCLYQKKLDHPLMDNPAFDIIGDQGFKQDISLEELQGDYECTLWLLDENDNHVGSNPIDCIGIIKENTLNITWTIEGVNTAYMSPPFKLDQGLLFSEEDDPSLICAVKVYPDGHMVDGIGTLDQEDTERRIHFQMTK